MSTTAEPVRNLADVRMADVATVGGKAAGLGDLLALGVRAPNGVVFTADAADLGADDRAALLGHLPANLGSGPFAVRSSGLSEDGADRSFAGIFETVLNVPAPELPVALERVLDSARGARLAGYQPSGNGHMAVIIQPMVAPAAAGVALTADPIGGDRATTIVTAVRGLGERLVSGEALGDEWVIRDDAAEARRRPESAIDERQALAIGREARRIAELRGGPQDIEWAIDETGVLWILQARPMTALPPDVSWEPGARGGYTRSLRFGEWISEPVTPLFESWLLITLEERLHANIRNEIGQHAPLPHHVIVNGWYFYSLNWIAPGNMLRSLPNILWHVIRQPRAASGVIPATVRFSFPIMERRWRTDVQPRYRAAVAAAEARVEQLPVAEIPALIDEMAALAGDYTLSLVALAGAAYKMEINLAKFYRRHLAPTLGGSHLPLVSGIESPGAPGPHAVVSLDWVYPPGPRQPSPDGSAAHRAAVEARHTAEEAAEAALAGSPRRLRAFRQLLADAQHLVPIREEQTAEFTLPWPVMHRAVLRIGEELNRRGLLPEAEDVFFLTRREVLAALDGTENEPLGNLLQARRSLREEQSRLVPPVFIGRFNRFLRSFFESYPTQFGAVKSDRALVSGVPAAPGRVTGSVRIIRGPDEFEALRPGEILVAPLTAPAWTPLFTRAAAVVTDTGSAAAHASIIAREYGIPAVVGCGDATARLQTGMQVTVDGSTGNVEPA